MINNEKCHVRPKIDVLISCMFQDNMDIVEKSGITGDAVVIDQCDEQKVSRCSTAHGQAVMYSVTDRGLTKSRNLAIEKSDADICMLCDDDELFVKNYREKICKAYKMLPQADVIAFKITDAEDDAMSDRPQSFPDKVIRLHFPQTMHIASWQISFRRSSLVSSGVRFDELLGAGSGNGAQEELKFLLDCERAGLKIYYVPSEIASVRRTSSTWFKGFDEQFFEQRGATTRYILGLPLASLYAVYYVVKKRKMLDVSPLEAIRATFRGILKNSITKQKCRQQSLKQGSEC